MNGYTPHDTVMAQLWDSWTDQQRKEYLDSYDEVEAEIEMCELVYKMRTDAGITQTELARRMGARQPFISAIERGAKSPTVATLKRIARATGNTLQLTAVPSGA